MKEFIDKLISRLKEKAYNHFDLKLSDAIEIVNELAEEYINCSTDISTNKSDTSTISKMENVSWVIDGKGIHKQTNADRIRSMTDEELAEFLDNMCLVKADFHCEECNNPLNCDVCYLDWLQSEAE